MSIRFESNAEPIPGYRLLERLGSGGFGEVWKCEAPGGIFKAVKIIHGDLRSKDNDLVRYAEQELKALKRVKTVRHPYLLALDRYDIVDGRLLIVMELADCNLWDRFRQCRQKGLPGIPRDELMLYMAETAEVLDLMNVEHQLLHLDIKPQNIFLQYNHVKVGDFGQVKDLEGVVASVTGGITPVYAAPETFDGIVTRYCDQYSLACVYQELLTGQRPFDGTSMQQLLMQHLAAPPNLQPSPPADRVALNRALAKKPEDRFPGCRALVQALRDGGAGSAAVGPGSAAATPPGGPPTPPADRPGLAAVLLGSSARIEVSLADTEPTRLGGSGLVLAAPVPSPVADTPLPLVEAEPAADAPPEQTGPGPVRPALVIGVGQLGLRVVQRLRKLTADRFGPPDRTPAVRTLFIDTDPDTLAAATADRPADGLAALQTDEVVPARLNRSTHYLKPRLNGRTLIEGWFDPQLLHRLPRTPVTMGLRSLGRLAFCDHYRAIAPRVAVELVAALEPQALGETLAATGLELRTNRPRVYVVAGLAGGTGGGMFLDLAYTVRHRLKKLGYADPQVVGVLFAPPDDPAADVPPQVRANAYAALTELHHYSRPDTLFQAHYDDRPGYVRDADPPFAEVILLPAPAGPSAPLTPAAAGVSGRVTAAAGRRPGGSDAYRPSGTLRGQTMMRSGAVGGSGLRSGVAAAPAATAADPTAVAADYLRLELFGPVGRLADQVRLTRLPAAGGPAVRTFGLVRYDWPRWEVIDRTARVFAGVVLDHWVAPDFGRARERVPGWVDARLTELGLTADALPAALRRAADLAAAAPVDAILAQATDLLVPRGWLAKLPDANQVLYAADQIGKLVGCPAGGRPPGSVEETVRAAAAEAADGGLAGLTAAAHALIDDPAFRLSGADEVVRFARTAFDQLRARYEADAERAEADARAGYELLMAYAHPARGARKPAPGEVGDALRAYPAAQYRGVVLRHAARVYDHLKASLAGLLNELAMCRQKLQGLQAELVAELDRPALPVGPRVLMPPGCPSVEEAAQRFLGVLTDDDLHAAEQWVQTGIERRFGGLYQACLNSADGPGGLLRALRDQTRGYLNDRLGEVDLAAMFQQRFGPTAAQVFAQAFTDAEPDLVPPGPWSRSAVTVLGTPPGATGEPLRRAADAGFPADDRTTFADTPDEATVYREYPAVPLAALPQLGPGWAVAYQAAGDALCSPHARIDVTRWVGVDE